MNYDELSLDELKKIAKENGITFGNIGKEKLIEKLKSIDSENNTSATDNEDNPIPNSDESKGVVEEITDVVSGLEGFGGVDKIDTSIEDIGLDEEVICMSITFGGLIYTSPITGATYMWNNIGDEQSLTVKELVAMNNSKPVFLNRPWIILKDPRAINKFRLMSKYEDVAKINQLGDLFKKGDLNLIESTIDSAMKAGMREVVISNVRAMYNNGTLTNTHIISLLEDKLKFDVASE